MPMNQNQADRLRRGVYRIFWVDGKNGLACIGKHSSGATWYCPVDFPCRSPHYGWDLIERVVLIASDDPIRTKTCRAAVCFNGNYWKYATLSTIPEDADEDSIIKVFMDMWTNIDRVFIVSTEENKE